jgi:Calcium binding protein from Anabaena CcbP.
MEIVVDCYNEHEARSGWQCYLSARLTFPFQAEGLETRCGSPLKAGERVTVTALFDDDDAADALAPMQVEIVWQGRSLTVPLSQLRGVDVDEQTAEAIADWHYWIAQGRCF